MWELDYKESWVQKNWCFWTVAWRRLLRVPWTARRSKQSILKEISPEYSLEELMLKLKLQYFGHLMQRTDSFEKTLMLEKIEDRRRRAWQDEIIGSHHRLDGHEVEHTPGVGEGQGSLACCSLWGCKESDTTEWLKNNKNNPAYKLNKQGDNIQPWHTPFPIWNQSIIPCLVLTIASWPAYKFLRRQIKWSGILISLRKFSTVGCDPHSQML